MWRYGSFLLNVHKRWRHPLHKCNVVKDRKVGRDDKRGRYLHKVELVVDSVSWLWILQHRNEKSNISTKER